MVHKASEARERFEKAALELFRKRGYAETTVPQIAAAAGLTERTFFRYFADKPEVLFWRASELQSNIADAVKQASDYARPFEAVVGALEVVGPFFDARRADVIARQTLVAAYPDFQEREMMKMRSLALSISEALQERGVPAPAARMAAEIGVAIWRVAIEQWSTDEKRRSFSHHIRSSHLELNAVMSGMAASPTAAPSSAGGLPRRRSR
jgi:AcrR family transcriptional regulator